MAKSKKTVRPLTVRSELSDRITEIMQTMDGWQRIADCGIIVNGAKVVHIGSE